MILTSTFNKRCSKIRMNKPAYQRQRRKCCLGFVDTISNAAALDIALSLVEAAVNCKSRHMFLPLLPLLLWSTHGYFIIYFKALCYMLNSKKLYSRDEPHHWQYQASKRTTRKNTGHLEVPRSVPLKIFFPMYIQGKILQWRLLKSIAISKFLLDGYTRFSNNPLPPCDALFPYVVVYFV